MSMNRVLLIVSLIFLGMSTVAVAEEAEPSVSDDGLNPLVSGKGRVFEGRLAPHDSIYFVFGADPAAKFQFSLKYRFLDLQKEESSKKSKSSLYFAYTQRSLWDVTADSSPFYDSSYMPELIFESAQKDLSTQTGPFCWYGYQAAYRHESNGKDGFESRSLDIFYLRPIFSIGARDKWHAIFFPELSTTLATSSENEDIDDYRGFAQFRGAIGKGKGVSLGYLIRAGKDFDRFTYQLELSIPLREVYLQLQYFDGYGESLRSYSEKSSALRIGVSLVR